MAINEDSLFEVLGQIMDRLDAIQSELSSIYSNQANTSDVEYKLDDIIRLLKDIRNNTR